MPEQETHNRPSMAERVLALFTKPKLPAWAVILLQIYQQIPSQKSNIEFWLTASRSMGGVMADVASILQAPLFNLTMVLVAILWLIFVGEPKKGIPGHSWIVAIGWSVFTICFTVITVTAGYGAIQIYIREQVAEIQEKYLTDGANPNMPSTQIDAYMNTQRHLSHEQMRFLLAEVAELKEEMPRIVISHYGDGESIIYSADFSKVFEMAGFEVVPQAQSPQGREQTGVMIATNRPLEPSPHVDKIRNILISIGIVPKIIPMPKSFNALQKMGLVGDIVIYIGPKPL